MGNVLKEFKDFVLRGNVLDLAVAIVIGAAFTAVVNSLVRDVLTPFVTAITGRNTFGDLTFTLHGSVFAYGNFLNQVISFVITAAAVFFFVVKPINHLMQRLGRLPEETPVRDCPDCLSQVPAAATRCAQCTSPLTPVA